MLIRAVLSLSTILQLFLDSLKVFLWGRGGRDWERMVSSNPRNPEETNDHPEENPHPQENLQESNQSDYNSVDYVNAAIYPAVSNISMDCCPSPLPPPPTSSLKPKRIPQRIPSLGRFLSWNLGTFGRAFQEKP